MLVNSKFLPCPTNVITQKIPSREQLIGNVAHLRPRITAVKDTTWNQTQKEELVRKANGRVLNHFVSYFNRTIENVNLIPNEAFLHQRSTHAAASGLTPLDRLGRGSPPCTGCCAADKDVRRRTWGHHAITGRSHRPDDRRGWRRTGDQAGATWIRLRVWATFVGILY